MSRPALEWLTRNDPRHVAIMEGRTTPGFVAQRRLGARIARDDRDYPAARALDLERPSEPRALVRVYRYWYERWNQNQTGPTCVANTAGHRLGDSPRTWPLSWLDTLSDRRPLIGADGVPISVIGYASQYSGQTGFRGLLYDQAQLVDEWGDTPPGGGTSFRAAAKVLQRWGLIDAYLWCASVDEVAQAVLNHGPVALGCEWREGMYYVDDGDTLLPTGQVIGGHEVLLSGVNLKYKRFRVQTWGQHFVMPFDTLGAVLPSGDACLVTETL